MTKKESGKYSKYHGPATEGADSSELVDLQTLFTQRQDRLANALKERYQYKISIKQSQEFFYKYVSSRVPLIIMYADLVGSTKMSMTLPTEKISDDY
jgi:adenylate cyclase